MFPITLYYSLLVPQMKTYNKIINISTLHRRNRIFGIISIFISVVLLFILIYTSIQPGSILLKYIPFSLWDKFLHFSAYFIFGLSLLYGFFHGFRLSMKSSFVCSIILSTIVGSLTEYLQYSFPEFERSAEVLDFIANFLGASFILFILFLRKIYAQKG